MVTAGSAVIGVPPWGYAELGHEPFSPPAPLLQHVRPDHYAALERLMPPRRDAQPPVDPLRVAETIADPSLIGHLVERARRGDPERRSLAYFTLGWIARHFGAVVADELPWPSAQNNWPAGRPDVPTALRVAHDVAAVLVEVAGSERDLFLGNSALVHLSHLPQQVQLAGSRLPQLMQHPSWQLRHPALEAAHLCPVQEVEPVLLAAAAASDMDGAASAATHLRRCSPARAVPVLTGLLGESKTDVRVSALDSLVALIGHDALPHVRQAAATWPPPARYAAYALLAEHGTADDVPLIAERVRRLLGRARKMEDIPSELTFELPFLLAHVGHPEVNRALDKVRRRWSALFDGERAWVGAHHPELMPAEAVVPPVRTPRHHLPRCPTDLDALVSATPRRWLPWRRIGR